MMRECAGLVVCDENHSNVRVSVFERFFTFFPSNSNKLFFFLLPVSQIHVFLSDLNKKPD